MRREPGFPLIKLAAAGSPCGSGSGSVVQQLRRGPIEEHGKKTQWLLMRSLS